MAIDSTQRALGLMRRGRFIEASQLLDHQTSTFDISYRPDQRAVLADALQRIGQNDRAELLCQELLKKKPLDSPALPLTHFVLGNVQRERGYLANAAQHYQQCIDSRLAASELVCWGELRLAATIAEMDGTSAALARLPNVRAAIAECGDVRPFIAFHIWLAELESLNGLLPSARQHLARAESLLTGVEDFWLQGYLAVNSAVVHCYGANMSEARQWAEAAIQHAGISGHRSTRCAAHSTLGHIECSEGNLGEAEGHFRTGLDCCEERSISQIAILDSIAQVQLEQCKFRECRATLRQIENSAEGSSHAKLRRYGWWILQTKVQLLLKEGRAKEARLALAQARNNAAGSVQPLVSYIFRLLAAETLITSGEVSEAMLELDLLLSSRAQLQPDLVAQTEQLLSGVFAQLDPYRARVHMERAGWILKSIGHRVRSEKAATELQSLRVSDDHDFVTGVRTSVDRFFALMGSRDRPDILGYEAFSLLVESQCASGVSLNVAKGSQVRLLRKFSTIQETDYKISVILGRVLDGEVELLFTPKEDVLSRAVANQIKRLLDVLVLSRPITTETSIAGQIWPLEWAGGDGFVFASKTMMSILETVRKVSKARISVLITGETGVGKEVIARTIHDQSDRVRMPFIALNCAAIPKELLESQLFGHRRGAFSGAHDSFQGIVRAANGGTVLLDEIGELTLDAQAKLLRFLESGEIHPIGEPRPISANVRLLFATNENLDKAVECGRFRLDLYYRIKVVSIRVPPLRERREEIPLLANLFAKRFAAEFSKGPLRFSDAAMEHLVLHSWPGNIRELANEIRRLAALTDDDAMITPQMLSSEVLGPRMPLAVDDGSARNVSISLNQPLAQAIATLEREMLARTLDECGGQVTDAARKLGLSRKGLYLKRKRLGLGAVRLPERASGAPL